ncbi:metalloprotease [Corynebacterium poyangense]|uniref:Metalloprotease n=1 Tax=Corynebacterium poyangense TaxID=2684405 RepID=A0A7H0SP38_9CORY|nr:neutral zinc metallopeptidase [Corynebacterium poyangense]MBZ8177881.1 metalloprotease [Corynebacterium poyangense]QNQ90313.1 metalloprotease [Corynebacterium poyangense]
MTFKPDVHKERNIARRGGGGGGRIALGGGLGTVVLVGLYLLMGGNPGDLEGLIGSQNNSTNYSDSASDGFDECQTAEDANSRSDCRVEFTAMSVFKTWEEQLPRQAGIQFQEPGLVIFQDSTQSGCGFASGSTGPFYCPADHTAYFDVSFFKQLEKFGGTDAPLAEMYIVAHEYGHHIQSLENTLSLSDYNDPGENSNAVKIELQADCYAGIWAHWADKGDNAMLEKITPEQVQSVIRNAQAVGDDNIQKRSGGQVRPDQWTHGSSDQRAHAFLSGYEKGTMAACDTLGRNVYRNG